MRSIISSRYVQYSAAAIGLWTAVALLFASESYLSGLYRGTPVDFAATVGYSLAFYGTWALVTPAVLAFARRWPLTGANLLRHAAAGVVVALLQAGLFAWLFWPVYGPPNGQESRLDLWAAMSAAHFPSNLLIYAMLAGGAMALAARVAARDREAHAARLEARLKQAELDALRARIHPHFLFNTLHGISALVRKDPREAERLIAKLGALLRSALEHERQDFVPLAAEIEFLRNYLDIEGARFGERLRSSITMDEHAADALVPPLLLQPLVENAIRHGLAATPSAVTIEVRGSRSGNRLELGVKDDGGGADPSALTDGIGLGNVRARLQQIFAGEQSMRIRTAQGGGFDVALELPFRLAEPVQ